MRSYDASTRTDLPVPFELVGDVVADLRRRSDRVVVIGAVARDLLASGAGGLPVARATVDIDVAIAVERDADYADLGELRLKRTQPHFEYRGMPVDVLPFGGIERDRHVLFANDHLLDVTGMSEAAEHAVQVTLPGGAIVPVASLESLTVLKLIAWRSRGDWAHRKDALDLAFIFTAAWSGLYLDGLYEDPALEAEDFDLEFAATYRLGRDAALTLGPAARSALLDIIIDVDRRESLARAMAGIHSAHALEAYLRGFRAAPYA